MPDFLDIGQYDFMARSTSLRIHAARRTFFDPTNPEHCESLKAFLQTGSWGKIQFFPEQPYTDVPATVLSKFAMHSLKVTRMTASEKAKLAAANRGPLTDITTENLAKGEVLMNQADPADLSELMRKVVSPGK